MARHSIRPVRLPLAVASGRATTGTPERPRRRPARCMRPGPGKRRAHAVARGPARPPPAPHAPPAPPLQQHAHAALSSGRSARRAHLRARSARPRRISRSKATCLRVLRQLGHVDALLAHPPVARSRRAAVSRQRMQHGTFCMRVEARDHRMRGADGMRARIGRWFESVASTHLDARARAAGAALRAALLRRRARAGHPSRARCATRPRGRVPGRPASRGRAG